MRKFFPYAVLVLGAVVSTVNAQQPAPPAQGAAAPQAAPLTAADKASAVELLAQRLSTKYVFADSGDKMAAEVRGHLRKGDYDKVGTRAKFAELLTAHLHAAVPDRHLLVRFMPQGAMPDRPRPKLTEAPPPEMLKRMKEVGKYWNFAFEKVERLPGNVMYVKVDSFFGADLAKPVVTAAMNFAASGDAMIIDLRENGSGDPRTVAYMASYLLGDKKVHLSDIVFRADKETDAFWSDPSVPGAHFGPSKPVYVLTSDKTFSAAEDFTYNLQALKRVIVVGDTSKGGAHPAAPFRIDPYMVAIIPAGRTVNPITKGNWEGTGVKPDVAIAADKALTKAHALALQALLPQVNDPEDRPILQQKLEELQAALK